MRWSDKQLLRMERRIRAIYKEAQGGIEIEWDKYMSNASKRLQRLQNAYDRALKTGVGVEQAKTALETAQRNITFQDNRYRVMVDNTTSRIASANEQALAYLNGEIANIYRYHFNEIGEEAVKLGINFTGYDENTVQRLIKQGKIQLPKKKISIPKDKRWNTRQLNSSVLQGILQGESMDKIAKRIFPIVDYNVEAAIRNARTMVTGAENAGRLDSYKELEDEGVVQKKVWIATPDSRTRKSHLALDGKEIDINDEFLKGLEYPGDPNGEPEEVYNCRCSMRTHIIGFKRKDGSISYVNHGRDRGIHQEQIEEEKERRKNE